MNEEKENSRKGGVAGEDYAVQTLEEQGYKVLERNWRAGRFEIDLIAQKNQNLHFIEVKTRSSSQWGNPASFVSKSQQLTIIRLAGIYVRNIDWDPEISFDIFSIIRTPQGANYEWLKGAFYPPLSR